MKDKGSTLFVILGTFFVCNALLAEFIGVKIFSVERTFGFEPFGFSLFGQNDLSFHMTAGVLLWPVVFIMTDVINEYFGQKGVRFLSFLTAGLIAYAFLMVYLAIEVSPARFWVDSKQLNGVSNMQFAFRAIFGQGMWIIVGSLIAFLIGQFVDVIAFRAIRKRTGHRMIWLRATGSTLISQFIDSYVVLVVAFYIGADWPLIQVLAIGTVGYIYKFLVAILSTPVLYGVHFVVDSYLGLEKAREMAEKAG